ncbi:unnamed protein product, partial [Closterium sp. NIES-54]
MGGSHMDHGRTSDVHDHANAALSNPILLWRGRKRVGLADALCTTKGSQTGRGKLSASIRVQMQNRKVRTETLSELETSCADPVDQHLGDVTLAAQGEHRGVTRVVVHHQKEVTLGLTTALLLLALTATEATPLRRAATSSTAASAASATSATSAPSTTATTASSASTAAADTSTPATMPTTTPTPSTATTTTSTAPASPTGALAPLALAGAASPARGRRSSDRLETTE